MPFLQIFRQAYRKTDIFLGQLYEFFVFYLLPLLIATSAANCSAYRKILSVVFTYTTRQGYAPMRPSAIFAAWYSASNMLSSLAMPFPAMSYAVP